MIGKRYPKLFCCEDLSLIENYELAVADKTQIWHCHHRKEIDEGLSRAELIEMGLYWNRPASELIFLTNAEHGYLHGLNQSDDKKTKIGAKSKGRHHTDETKLKQSITHIGENNPMARAIYQIDKNTCQIIKKWNCMNDVSRALGICAAGISACCRGIKKSAGGFKWKYAE